jgi:hypothetical protein
VLYGWVWCAIWQEEKKFIHFDINLLILDHSWLNEIDIRSVRRSLAGLRIKSINLEISEYKEDSNLNFTIEVKFSVQMSHKKSKPTRDRVADWDFYEFFIYAFFCFLLAKREKLKFIAFKTTSKRLGMCASSSN